MRSSGVRVVVVELFGTGVVPGLARTARSLWSGRMKRWQISKVPGNETGLLRISQLIKCPINKNMIHNDEPLANFQNTAPRHILPIENFH